MGRKWNRTCAVVQRLDRVVNRSSSVSSSELVSDRFTDTNPQRKT